jgi:hypothetical protein
MPLGLELTGNLRAHKHQHENNGSTIHGRSSHKQPKEKLETANKIVLHSLAVMGKILIRSKEYGWAASFGYSILSFCACPSFSLA